MRVQVLMAMERHNLQGAIRMNQTQIGMNKKGNARTMKCLKLCHATEQAFSLISVPDIILIAEENIAGTAGLQSIGKAGDATHAVQVPLHD